MDQLPYDLKEICLTYLGKDRSDSLSRVHDELIQRVMDGSFLVSQILERPTFAIVIPRFYQKKRCRRNLDRLLVIY